MISPRPGHFGLLGSEVEELERLIHRRRQLNKVVAGIVLVSGWILAALLVNAGNLAIGIILGLGSLGSIDFVLSSEKLTKLWCIPRHRQVQAFFDYERSRNRWWLNQQGKRIDYLTSVSGIQFEQEVAAIYREKGYSARVTSPSGDDGIDIVLCKDKTIVVQCKNHKSPLGPKDGRELIGTLAYSEASEAYLVSTSGFTKGLQRYARGKPLKLVGLEDLISVKMPAEQKNENICFHLWATERRITHPRENNISEMLHMYVNEMGLADTSAIDKESYGYMILICEILEESLADPSCANRAVLQRYHENCKTLLSLQVEQREIINRIVEREARKEYPNAVSSLYKSWELGKISDGELFTKLSKLEMAIRNKGHRRDQ